MSMEPKTVAYVRASIDAEGVVTATRRYNCTLVRSGVGEYDITIGEGGADVQLCMVDAVSQTGALAGAGSVRAPSVIQTSDTVKHVQFRADDGDLYDPNGFWIEIKRYAPIPAA